jgi:hypothetical protein
VRCGRARRRARRKRCRATAAQTASTTPKGQVPARNPYALARTQPPAKARMKPGAGRPNFMFVRSRPDQPARRGPNPLSCRSRGPAGRPEPPTNSALQSVQRVFIVLPQAVTPEETAW